LSSLPGISWNRIADENHGTPIPEKLEKIILMRKTAHEIMDKVVRRAGMPLIIIKVDTDDTTKMNTIKTKYKDMVDKGEAMVVPNETAELMQIAINLNIDIIDAWLYYLQKYFLISEGVPEVILGAISSKDSMKSRIPQRLTKYFIPLILIIIELLEPLRN
jgi:hypothetical protein